MFMAREQGEEAAMKTVEGQIMHDDYKTILATCMRLKDSALNNITPISPNMLCQSLQILVQEVNSLVDALPQDFQAQKHFLELDRSCCITRGFVDPYGFGALVRDLDNLNAIVNARDQATKNKVAENKGTCKKIFISHASKDKEIVDSFVTLLTRGGRIAQDDIFCTSIDGMKITNGEDIRKHIQENVNYADFAILLISKNYKESEVCLNEMGAVWAIDKKVKAYVFPDLQEEKVGWLINNNAAEKLNNPTALASLYEELQQFYGLPLSMAGWTAQAMAFCEKFK